MSGGERPYLATGRHQRVNGCSILKFPIAYTLIILQPFPCCFIFLYGAIFMVLICYFKRNMFPNSPCLQIYYLHVRLTFKVK